LLYISRTIHPAWHGSLVEYKKCVGNRWQGYRQLYLKPKSCNPGISLSFNEAAIWRVGVTSFGSAQNTRLSVTARRDRHAMPESILRVTLNAVSRSRSTKSGRNPSSLAPQHVDTPDASQYIDFNPVFDRGTSAPEHNLVARTHAFASQQLTPIPSLLPQGHRPSWPHEACAIDSFPSPPGIRLISSGASNKAGRGCDPEERRGGSGVLVSSKSFLKSCGAVS